MRVNQPVQCAAVFESTTSGTHTALFMDSKTGDFVGAGRQWLYNTSNITFTATPTDTNSLGVTIRVSGDTFWTLSFDAPGTAALGPGQYFGAIRYPFNGFLAGIDVSGDGRGCNRETGSFVVYEVGFGPDGSVQRFAADFEQHCENSDAGLFGAIRYNSTTASLVPFAAAYPSYRLTIPRPAHGAVAADGIIVQCDAGPVRAHAGRAGARWP